MDKQEQGVESIDDRINRLASEIEERQIESNGFLTKKGRLISKPEIHAVALGISPIGLAYVLPTPLGEFMAIAFLLMLRTIFKNLNSIDGHLADVMHEIAYTWTSAFATALVFDQFTGYSLTRIDMGKMLARLMLGA